MSIHIGLAFCVDKIYFARFIKKDHTLFLDQLGSALYPFPYNEPDLFNEENIPLLAEVLKTNLMADPQQAANLYICIESNLASLKRIALPDNFNKDEEQEHILWDLGQSLIEPVNSYTFFKTQNVFQSETGKDYLTIAIQKRIITFFQDVCTKAGFRLADISVNQLVTEIALRNMLGEKKEGLIVLFKIGSSRMESTFIWNGIFHSSHYERTPDIAPDADWEDTLIKTIRSKLKQMEILFEQYLQREIRVSTIYLYGNHIADGFLQTLEKSLSVISLRLNPLQNVDKTEGMEKNLPALEEVTKYVESIGVVLDQ